MNFFQLLPREYLRQKFIKIFEEWKVVLVKLTFIVVAIRGIVDKVPIVLFL